MKNLIYRITILFILTFLIGQNSKVHATSYYTVRGGDTLGDIAHKFGTSVYAIKKANRMHSNFLVTGRRLKVPGKARSYRRKSRRPEYYRVKPGDSLSKIASRYGMRTSTLVRMNGIKNPSKVISGRLLRLAYHRSSRRPREVESTKWISGIGNSKVMLPSNYKLEEIKEQDFKGRYFDVKLFAHRFAVGHAVYLEIVPHKGVETSEARVLLEDKEVPVTSRPWGYRAIMGFSAYRKAGNASLQVKIKINKQEEEALPVSSVNALNSITVKPATPVIEKEIFHIKVENTEYPQTVWNRYLGNFDRKRKEPTDEQKARWRERAKEREDFIRKSNDKKKAVFSLRSSDMLDEHTAHPRGYHRVTSRFFTNRKIVKWYRKNGRKQFKEPHFIWHSGLDLAGRPGKPIYAMADGRVVCSQRMYVEGNFTVVDHGNGVFSGYMHQSKMIAKEGDEVSAGQVLGRVGTTGWSTGPHLHVSVWIRGKPVHPLSLLGLPIR